MAVDSESHDSAPRRDIHQIRRYVKDVRGQYYNDLAKFGTVRDTTHERLQTAALRYWDALHEYGDEQTVQRAWKQNNIDRIPELAETTVRVPERKPGYGGGESAVEKPAISEVPPNTLLAATQKLDEIAKELGFGAHIKAPINDDADPI